MTAASCPEYARLDSLDALERFHADVRLAERDGAVQVQRDQHHGEGSRLRRIQVRDVSSLAAHLGVTLHVDLLEDATRRLHPWRSRVPAVEATLAAWAAGRRVRGRGPDAVHELLAALEVADDAAQAASGERILRRESVRLFGDSKRIESLTPWLDLLLSGDTAASGLEREQVWAAFGLHRQPQPMLLAGLATVRADGREVPLVAPYTGLPPERVEGLDGPVAFLLSVENLTAFHEAARLEDARPRLLLYTGGMPSPAWMRAWQSLLRCIAPSTPVFHWGDMDEGGFRIARRLAAGAEAIGVRLQPWAMAPSEVPEAARFHASRPSPSVLARMCASATQCGWHALAAELASDPLLLEQEALRARLP